MGGEGGGGSVGNASVPASSRKVVQILKEIVNCSDLEIYAMLVECDMDPNETVSRLLSQDIFHEVKSKRDKKKETNTTESWTCNILNRKAISNSLNGYNSAQGNGNIFNSNEMGSAQGVHANRRENGTHNYWTGSSPTSGALKCQPPPNSDPTNVGVKKETQPGDAVASFFLPISTSQSAWINANPGHRTMADIVKMGRPLNQKNTIMPRPSETQENGNKTALNDEWPLIEKQNVSYSFSSVLKSSADSKAPIKKCSESQNLGKIHLVDEVSETKTNPIVSPPDAVQVSHALVSTRNLCDNDYYRDSLVDEDEKTKAEGHALEENGGFQKLITDNEDNHEILPKEYKPLVINNNHLQVQTSTMFDSFDLELGSGKASSCLKDNMEDKKETEDNVSFRYHEKEIYGEEEEDIVEKMSYQIGSADYGFENSQHLNHLLGTHSPMQNLDNFSNIMQGYTGSLTKNLLPSGIQDVREPDFHYSPFLAIYNNAIPSSSTDPTISMVETLKAASISPQNTMFDAEQQTTTLAQHLALNPYSHHLGMPLWHYGNLIRYPFMPQSYNPYMPLAFQQAFPTYIPHGFDDGASSSNNFPLDPINTPKSYKDVLTSQFKESNHLASPLQQQNENLVVGHLGQQRNSCVVSQSRYYSLPGHQNQQLHGLFQVQLQQQQSSQQQQQHFGGDDYINPYQLAAEESLEHLHHQQQQNARDASKQIQQHLWPDNY